MENPKDWRFPMTCPVCQASQGFPYFVTSDDASVTVQIVCSGCRNDWSITAPSPSLFLMRKTDRRQTPRTSTH